MPDDTDELEPAEKSQAEVEAQAAREPDDRTTHREEVETTKMEHRREAGAEDEGTD